MTEQRVSNKCLTESLDSMRRRVFEYGPSLVGDTFLDLRDEREENEHLRAQLEAAGNPEFELERHLLMLAESEKQNEALTAQIQRMKPVVDAQDKYIKALESACGNLTVFAHVHGFQATDDEIEEGKNLRKKIAELKSAVEQHDAQPTDSKGE